MKNTIKLYKASIPYGTNGLAIYEGEFTETTMQFRRTGSRTSIIPKNRDGEPGMGYARTPGGAIVVLRLEIERRLDSLRGEMAILHGKLNIVNKKESP